MQPFISVLLTNDYSHFHCVPTEHCICILTRGEYTKKLNYDTGHMNGNHLITNTF